MVTADEHDWCIFQNYKIFTVSVHFIWIGLIWAKLCKQKQTERLLNITNASQLFDNNNNACSYVEKKTKHETEITCFSGFIVL